MGVNLDVVLNWHGDEANYFSTEPIYCTDVCHTVHYQLLVLINVQLVSEVACMVGNRIQLPGS